MHLIVRQLVRDHAHLFVDVILTHTFRECRELTFYTRRAGPAATAPPVSGRQGRDRQRKAGSLGGPVTNATRTAPAETIVKFSSANLKRTGRHHLLSHK